MDKNIPQQPIPITQLEKQKPVVENTSERLFNGIGNEEFEKMWEGVIEPNTEQLSTKSGRDKMVKAVEQGQPLPNLTGKENPSLRDVVKAVIKEEYQGSKTDIAAAKANEALEFQYSERGQDLDSANSLKRLESQKTAAELTGDIRTAKNIAEKIKAIKLKRAS